MRVVINGSAHTVPEGWSVLQAIESAGSSLPTLCHDERLTPTGGCRLCLVNVKGIARPLPACATPLLDGMEIETHTPALEAFRRMTLQLLARRYPPGAAAWQPEKQFHESLAEYGVDAASYGPFELRAEQPAHPYIAVDMRRCINCYRCVRICDEVQGQHVWHVRGRGVDTVIRPDGPSLAESSCVSCGACVDTCPTGALDDEGANRRVRPSRWTRTTCPYCGTGCEMDVGTHDDRIVAVKPVVDAPVSKGHLCVKGRYAFEFVHAMDRVTEPMIRTRRGWTVVSWERAVAFTAHRLRRIIRRHGPDAVGILGSARATNEENYLAQKLARAVVGTHNVDCCARVCHAPSAAALKSSLGAGLATNSFDDIERARTILVCGANPTENHPVVGARIKQAVRKGAHLIVVDPRRIELTDDCDVHLALRPGTNVALLNALAHVIVTEDLVDANFVESRVAGFETFSRSIAAWTPERAASICGVDADSIRQAARLYATAAPAMSVHGLGLTEHVQGTDGVAALVNLALLTGNVGRAGAGVNPLRGQNNVQGAAHMGCDPAVLPGSTAIEAGRPAFERAWGVTLPAAGGLGLLDMMDAAAAGHFKALWAIGYDVLLTNPNATVTGRALGALDLVVVQDMFMTETAREFGTVFLPACSSFEKEGSFMNAERRVQRVRRAIAPVGQSRPDWRIICDVAQAMGADGFAFERVEQIWDEVRSLCEGARGMTYARLNARGLQWPCPGEAHPGTSILHEDTFACGKAILRVIEPLASPEQSSSEYPFVLITGRGLYQFNAGTMTSRTRNQALRPTDYLDISPPDAATLQLDDGDAVTVVSRYGAAVVPVHVDNGVPAGYMFTTFHTPEAFVNAVTGPYRDAVTGTPEYKSTAVRIDVDREALKKGRRPETRRRDA